jgi:ribosomal protein L37AE/L43A
MGQDCHDTSSNCPVCGESRWWRSRTGVRVCQQCYPDAMAALQALADQRSGESRVPRASPLADHGDNVGLGPTG